MRSVGGVEMGRASGTETDATFFLSLAYEAPTILRLHHQGIDSSSGSCGVKLRQEWQPQRDSPGVVVLSGVLRRRVRSFSLQRRRPKGWWCCRSQGKRMA